MFKSAIVRMVVLSRCRSRPAIRPGRRRDPDWRVSVFLVRNIDSGRGARPRTPPLIINSFVKF
jgi:hypothetical protein